MKLYFKILKNLSIPLFFVYCIFCFPTYSHASHEGDSIYPNASVQRSFSEDYQRSAYVINATQRWKVRISGSVTFNPNTGQIQSSSHVLNLIDTSGIDHNMTNPYLDNVSTWSVKDKLGSVKLYVKYSIKCILGTSYNKDYIVGQRVTLKTETLMYHFNVPGTNIE